MYFIKSGCFDIAMFLSCLFVFSFVCCCCFFIFLICFVSSDLSAFFVFQIKPKKMFMTVFQIFSTSYVVVIQCRANDRVN